MNTTKNECNFYQRVYNIVQNIPSGKVMTYGQIASIISTPRSARVVGYALKALPQNTHIPWQRVVNHEGRITISNHNFPKNLQADLLQKESIRVMKKEGNWYVDLKKYLYTPHI